jgi:hypothetical protein
MVTVTSIKHNVHSSPSSAVAIVQTEQTGELCIVIVLSCLEIAQRKFATMYINVDLPDGGNVEQTLALRTCPANCQTALASLVASPGFRPAVLVPMVRKVLEVLGTPG